MAGERRINWGTDATDATYRTGDDDTNNRFIVAEDLDGGTVLLEWDESANSGAGGWVSRGAVDLDGNDLSGVGTLTSTAVNTDSGTVNGDTMVGFPTSTQTVSTSFGTWTTADANRPTLLVIEVIAVTDGSSDGIIDMDVDESGGTTNDYRVLLAKCISERSSGDDRRSTVMVPLPAGASFKIRNFSDPNNGNSIDEVRKLVL